MQSPISTDRLRFLLNRLRERLWVRPLAVCLISIAAVFTAKLADDSGLADFVPEVTLDSIETLLAIMASSMLMIATFSVSSMVSAYASTSNTATPRSFSLVVADDVSQNALSTFVGAFIFSVVALMAVKNAYFEKPGLFILFILTAMVFAIVIVTFVRWVDNIARLGRLGSTIDKVEKATARALQQRKKFPTLCAMPETSTELQGQPIFTSSVGYVQHIDMAAIQSWAEETHSQVLIAALPGTLAAPDQALAYISSSDHLVNSAVQNKSSHDKPAIDCSSVIKAFQIGNNRLFEDDPRFGLVVLSEIAARALSPAVNDSGTAITVISSLLRLLTLWNGANVQPGQETESEEEQYKYDRIAVPTLSMQDMFDDAFTAIARDGAGAIEVSVRLQKALNTLSAIGDTEMNEAALYHARLALKRARRALDVEEDIAIVEKAASFSKHASKQ
ncbi:DUF2254 domain-containing protein [Psychromonas arctica]|uniref:DUF2254 domain-containing protein n=1 Tax=Psychromonas arctica TaxID=168275 RepID=UPI0003FE69D9|nr:DUF2254 domain-containing protein [Psychromonas arctica]